MKKFVNKPADFVDEVLEGIYAAHSDQLAFAANDKRCLIRSGRNVKNKVGLATGGGSGHLPVFLGYVGEGMLDGCAVGDVFQSPSADRMLNVIREIDSGAGVVCVFGNYTGDLMNFEMAREMALAEGHRVDLVVVGDDVASAPRSESDKRRGVAGIFFAYKCAGAAAAEMADFDTVCRLARKAAANVRSIGVALSPNIIPEVGRPKFELGESEMEIGMGIHGEPGIRRGPLKNADDIVQEMLGNLLQDLPFSTGDSVAVLVNGLGATPLEELYILNRKASMILKEKKISVHRTYVGEFATSLEMAGASISLLKLDDELVRLLGKPARTPFFVQGQL